MNLRKARDRNNQLKELMLQLEKTTSQQNLRVQTLETSITEILADIKNLKEIRDNLPQKCYNIPPIEEAWILWGQREETARYSPRSWTQNWGYANGLNTTAKPTRIGNMSLCWIDRFVRLGSQLYYCVLWCSHYELVAITLEELSPVFYSWNARGEKTRLHNAVDHEALGVLDISILGTSWAMADWVCDCAPQFVPNDWIGTLNLCISTVSSSRI